MPVSVKGGKDSLESLLPETLSESELEAIGDDGYLAELTRKVLSIRICMAGCRQQMGRF